MQPSAILLQILGIEPANSSIVVRDAEIPVAFLRLEETDWACHNGVIAEADSRVSNNLPSLGTLIAKSLISRPNALSITSNVLWAFQQVSP